MLVALHLSQELRVLLLTQRKLSQAGGQVVTRNPQSFQLSN